MLFASVLAPTLLMILLSLTNIALAKDLRDAGPEVFNIKLSGEAIWLKI